MKLLNHLRIVKWRLLGSKKPTNMFRKQQIITRLQKQSGIRVFVETGTFMGDMTVAQSEYFNKLYTIELGLELYLKAQDRFKAYPKILGLYGDSSEVMFKLIDELNEPAIFWLDGHYSGEFTAKGKLECPLWGELQAIIQKKELKHILLIDDARLFVGTNDYPTIKEVEEFLTKNNIQFKIFIKDDIIHILFL